jgi:hypothetical protein
MNEWDLWFIQFTPHQRLNITNAVSVVKQLFPAFPIDQVDVAISFVIVPNLWDEPPDPLIVFRRRTDVFPILRFPNCLTWPFQEL